MEKELPKIAQDEETLKPYDWVTDGYKLTQEQIDAERKKNKIYWDKLNENSSAIEARRAEAYIVEVMSEDLKKYDDFPLDIYLDKEFVRRANILNNLLTEKYNCVVRYHQTLEKKDDNQQPYCQSEEFKKVEKDAKFVYLLHPESDWYREKGTKLNPLGDESYIVKEHDAAEIAKSYKYLIPYNKLPVYMDYDRYQYNKGTNRTEPAELYDTMEKGYYRFPGFYKLWQAMVMRHFAYDNMLISGMYYDHFIETKELVDTELKLVKEMYPKAAAACKQSVSCKANALKETLKQRDLIYMNSSIINQPDLVPQNDDVFMTKQFNEWFKELPAEDMEGFRVPDAAMIREAKNKYIQKKWEDEKAEAPDSEMSDSEAERVIKKEIESLNSKLKVKKIIFDSEWKLYTDGHGIPDVKSVEATVCISDPDRKGVVLCSRYPIEVIKPYTGGGKLVPIKVDSDGDIIYDYQGGARFGGARVYDRAKDFRYAKYNTPNHYYIATNIK
jgi:hypothetical protein